ncbi:MAG: DsrE family protein [Thermoplasmata archaeon]|nr:MAG: DsrE family protein [Thermoplasmata archaeon]
MVRKAPYGTEDAFAGLKLGLATIANGMETKIILTEDGVYNAMKNQNPEKIGMPLIVDAVNDLISLDVKIYCVEDHLKERGIKKEDLLEELVFIGEKEISDLSLGCDVVTSF